MMRGMLEESSGTEASGAVIALMARNCRDALKTNRDKVIQLADYFGKASIVVVENDSTDGTKEELEDWQKQDARVAVIARDGLFADGDRTSTNLSRIRRMAYYRNLYMEYADRIRPDYLIVIDIDIDSFFPEEVLSAMRNAPADWSALFANGRFYTRIPGKRLWGKYYDTFAFVPAGAEHYDLTFTEQRSANDPVNRELEDGVFLPCLSAFGGIGVYKWPLVEGRRYSAEKNARSGKLECLSEHISLNRSLAGKGKLYAAGSMRVMYQYQNPVRLLLGSAVSQSRLIAAARAVGIKIPE